MLPTSPPLGTMSLGNDIEQLLDDQVLENKSDLSGMLAIWVFGKGVHLSLILALITIALGATSTMVAARVLGELIEAVTRGDTATVTRMAAAFLGLESLAVLFQYVGRVGLAKATIEVAYRIRLALFAKMRRLPMTYFDLQPLGRTITRLTSDVEGIESFFGGTMARVLTAAITTVVVLLAMLATDPRFGGIIVLSSIPSLLFAVATRAPVRDSLRVYKRQAAHVNARLAEFLSGLPVIRLFGLEQWTRNLYVQATDSMWRCAIRTTNLNSLIRPATVLLCTLPTFFILWLGGEKVLAGTLPLATLVAFVRYSERFVAPIRTISQEIQNIQEALVSSERVRRMLAELDEDEVLGPDGQVSATLLGAVEFVHVTMGYQVGKPVLKDVSFRVAPGTKVGLVGASGSGKTSTLSLLPRLYPFQEGKILLDGVDIQSFNRQTLRQQLGLVGQDAVIIGGTIRDNLTMALPAGKLLSDEQIWHALAETGLADVVGRLPHGLNQVLVEGGDNLSMGERQLIAFTRMLLRDPTILLLDEATANIDEHCEQLIQKATFRLMQGRTCFIIAHRLSTILGCDLILVFEDGRVVEQGSHQSLMAAGGIYARMFGLQLNSELLTRNSGDTRGGSILQPK